VDEQWNVLRVRAPETEIEGAGPSPVVVRTGGLTFVDWTLAAVWLGLYPIGVVFTTLFSGNHRLSAWPFNAVGLGVLELALYILVFAVTSVRSVTLKPTGVEFRFLFHTERRGWSDLEPDQRPMSHGVWGLVSRKRDGRAARSRAFRLTSAQARALLSYPACPSWSLSRTLVLSLGVASAPP
jgi:hypothetical protein